jgi:hypothetical protein
LSACRRCLGRWGASGNFDTGCACCHAVLAKELQSSFRTCLSCRRRVPHRTLEPSARLQLDLRVRRSSDLQQHESISAFASIGPYARSGYTLYTALRNHFVHR